VRNYGKMNELNSVADLDTRHLRRLEAVQTSRMFRWLPRSWQRGLISAALRFALRSLAVLDGDCVHADRLRTEFRQLLPGQMPHYRYLGLDLGFAYRSGAVIPEFSPKPEAADSVMDYLPTTWPGARLPHLWVLQQGARRPLHDVLDPADFTLFTHPRGGEVWRAAVMRVNHDASMPLTCWTIGSAHEADLVAEDGDWARLSEIEATGAILVRPDGHVAWRCRQAPVDPTATLESVLCQLGCRAGRHGPDGCSSRRT
jgi:2,4-dichlorophenol 6-monooxygenase